MNVRLLLFSSIELFSPYLYANSMQIIIYEGENSNNPR